MKKIVLFLLLVAANAHAQRVRPTDEPQPDRTKPRFDISLNYNTEADRYEVYAQPNFTRQHFLLGPSQVSIVVPRQVADQSLSVSGATANWTDYSTVFAPAVAADVDFHGIHSMGKNIDVQKDTPFMLFFFSLKGGYVDGVRLYANGQDPGSRQKGMMGGDFSNTIQDYSSTEFYQTGITQAALQELSTAPTGEGTPTVVVYPNPITGDAFEVTARQFAPGERLKLHLISSTGVEFYALEEASEKLVNYPLRVPTQLSGQAYLYVERANATTGQRAVCTKLLILN